jgi:hypothetical protein
MYVAMQGQWVAVLRKVYQIVSEAEAAAATQNTMR